MVRKGKVKASVKDRAYVVVAAYNEETSIPKVVKDLNKHGYKNIVVVDDGSQDNTVDAARKAGATVLPHVVNRGQGASLQTGIEYALSQGSEYIVTFDADGQHQAKDLEKMMPPVVSGMYDVALGSRFLEGAGEIPPARKVFLKGALLVQTVLHGIQLTDAHNGFRVFSRKAAETIEITSDRMEHAGEIAEQIVKKGLLYKEVPVDILYTNYSRGKGQGSFFAGLRIIFQYVLRKLFK